MSSLELRGIGVTFGKFTAVEDVSLSVEPGQIVGLIGPNGAGKTVTFNVISGLEAPTQGSVWIDGVDVTSVSTAERTRMGLARTFQVIQLFAGMTVVENLMVAAHRFTSSGLISDATFLPSRRKALREARERAYAVLDFLGLTHLAEIEASDLPAGQARLVELGRALCLKPKVLLLDEPASGLDPAETHAFIDLLSRIRTTLGCGILLVEHDMGVVMPLCDHIVVMNFGRVLAAGTPAHVRKHPAVLSAYLGAPA